MDRRRALMMASGGDSDILYLLENRQFNDERIDTGITLFDTPKTFTIALDITITSNPTTGNGAYTRLLYAGTAMQLGKRNTTHTYYQTMWWNAWAKVNASASAPGRKKLIVSHSAGSNTVSVISKMDNQSPQTNTYTGTVSTSLETLSLGGVNAGDHLTTGTINKAVIYNRTLSQTEIDAFFA